MTDIATPATTTPAHSAFRVLAALADLGEATAAAIATHTDLGYSTVTPKLRAWETSGHAERFRNDANQTLWRLTATGHATTATTGEPATPMPTPPGPVTPTTGGTPAQDRQDTPAETPAPDGATYDNTDDDPAAVNPETGLPAAAETQNATAAEHTEPAGDDPAGQQGDGDKYLDGTAGEQPAPAENHFEKSAAPTSSAPATDLPVPAPSGPHRPDSTPTGNGDSPATTAADRRSSGSLRGAILDILEANPTTGYKVSELCKLIDRANEGTSAKKASAGAVANAAHKLAEQGQAVLRVEKPATFALAPADA